MRTTNSRALFSGGELREHLARVIASSRFCSTTTSRPYLVGLSTAGELVLHREQAHQFDLQEITKITKGAATDARAHTAPLRGGT